MNEHDLSHLLLVAFRSLDREIEAALADRGAGELRPSQALALLLVDRAGTRLSELAQSIVIKGELSGGDGVRWRDADGRDASATAGFEHFSRA